MQSTSRRSRDGTDMIRGEKISGFATAKALAKRFGYCVTAVENQSGNNRVTVLGDLMVT